MATRYQIISTKDIASGAQVITGTDNLNYATSKAIKDAGILPLALTGPITSSGNATTLITSLSFSAGSTTSTSNQTYELVSKAAFGGTINGILGGKTVSGSVTVAIKINGTNVTSLSAVSLTSTPADTSATGANTFSTGDDITAVFSSGSSDLGAAFTLKITRT